MEKIDNLSDINKKNKKIININKELMGDQNISSSDWKKPIKIEWNTRTISISDIISYVKDGDILIPEYQRNYVWSKKEASELIESILMNVPIPSIILSDDSHNNYKNKFLIIDGFQRIKTLFDFIYNKKYKNQKNVWKLVCQNSEWKDKSFNELTMEEQKLIQRAIFNVIIINYKNCSKNSIFHIFARINKGGIKLSQQQIRNSIYFSKNLQNLNNLAETLLEEEKIKISKKSKEKNKHSELLLRPLVLHYLFDKELDEIKSNRLLSNKINIVAEKIREKDEEKFQKTINELKEAINKTSKSSNRYASIKINEDNNNDDDFEIRSQTNPLIFETLVYVQWKNPNKNININNFYEFLKEDIKARINEEERISLFYNNTNKQEKIKGRIQKVESFFE